MRANKVTTQKTVFSQQSSNGSLSLQTVPNKENKSSQFQPYQADNIEIWTDVSHSHSPSGSSTMELIDAGDYKPSDYAKHWNPAHIIPTLEQLSAAQKHSMNQSLNIESHPNSLLKKLVVNKTKFDIFGDDKYLTHTVRYSARSPEDCCQIVRKIQHLMLIENKAI